MSSGFWEHLRDRGISATDFWRERRERRRRRAIRSGLPISVAMIADRDFLYECYLECRRDGGPGPGRDGVSYADLSNSEAGELLGSISQRILGGSYLPQKARTSKVPKPGKSTLRTLKLGGLIDRVVGKALARSLEPFWENVFLDCSYGFRPGSWRGSSPRGSWPMLAMLVYVMETRDRWVLAVDDVRTAFDTVPITAVMDVHRTLLDGLKSPDKSSEQGIAWESEKAKLLELIHTVLTGADPARERGIDQGNNYSPLALNGLFHHWLDVPVTSKIDAPLWFRYADNLAYLARSVSGGNRALSFVRRCLTPLGMALKGEDGVSDLKAGGEAQLMGFSLRHRNGKLVLGPGKAAFNQLGQNLTEAHEADNPPATARSSLLGWVRSLGPAFENGDDTIHVVLSDAAQYGFRGLASPDDLRRIWRESWEDWRRLRERVRQGAWTVR